MSFIPFANLPILNLTALDIEPYGCTHTVYAIDTRTTRVYMQQLIDGVVDDLEDMRVSRDKYLGAR